MEPREERIITVTFLICGFILNNTLISNRSIGGGDDFISPRAALNIGLVIAALAKIIQHRAAIRTTFFQALPSDSRLSSSDAKETNQEKLNKIGYSKDLPEGMECPITHQIMTNPAKCFSKDCKDEAIKKICFEEDAIKKWVNLNHTHPLSRGSVTLDDIIPDKKQQKIIDAFVLEKQKDSLKNHDLAEDSKDTVRFRAR